jgi:hypothetical protein
MGSENASETGSSKDKGRRGLQKQTLKTQYQAIWTRVCRTNFTGAKSFGCLPMGFRRKRRHSQDQRAEIADDGSSGQKPARARRDLVIAPVAGNLEKMVTGAVMRFAAKNRRRGHPGHRHETVRTFHFGQAKLVAMAVDDKLGARVADQSCETARVNEAAPKVPGGDFGRMVQHDDTDKTAPGGFGEKFSGGMQLALAQISRGNEQGGGNTRRQADQGDIAANPQIGERLAGTRLAGCPGREGAREIWQGAAHIGIMIAGHETDILGRTQGFQPRAGEMELSRKTKVSDVPCHRDVTWMMGLYIRDDLLQHPHVVDAGAGACPVQIAGDTFADELAPARARQGSEMRVGQMGKKEFYAGDVLLLVAPDAPPPEYPK